MKYNHCSDSGLKVWALISLIALVACVVCVLTGNGDSAIAAAIIYAASIYAFRNKV